MRILTQPFHRAIEHYWTRLMPEHEFLFWTPDEAASDGMPMRERGSNCRVVKGLPRKVDVVVSHTIEQWGQFRERYDKVLHWEHHLPYEPRTETFDPDIVVYLSGEARALWATGRLRYVIRHPIDTAVFNGWTGDASRALMVATMPMTWWGKKKGADLLRTMVDSGVPYKLVGKDNEQDWPMCQCEFVTSEERMLRLYRTVRVYGCTSPQVERAALEALAVGCPVVMRRHPFNTLVEEVAPAVRFADSDEEFRLLVMHWLEREPDLTSPRIEIQRQLIDHYFGPQHIRETWLEALQTCRDL